MSYLKESYAALGSRSRIVLVVCAMLIVLGTLAALWWALLPRHALLFGNLTEQDAAEIVGSLNEWKVEHSFNEDGTSIFVGAKDVHDTRMRLVSAGVPKGGHTGFELFDDNDFGVTEFAQRVNYQRALQGEMQRTISAMPGVSGARVHLSIKRPGLFLGQNEESKASVALSIKPGVVLSSKQVAGIKSLVAGAVEGLSPDAVVVIGPGGAPLSAGEATTHDASEQQSESALVAARLESRIATLLSTALGNETAAVSVDVTMNFDRVQRTSERLLAQPGSSSGLITKRQVTGGLPVQGEMAARAQDEQIEYAHGTEREEVILASGKIERLSIAVLLPAALTNPEVDHLRRLIAASVGLDPARGDRLEVATAPTAASDEPVNEQQSQHALSPARKVVDATASLTGTSIAWLVGAIAVGLLLGFLGGWLSKARKHKEMSDDEAEVLSMQIRSWISDGKSVP